MNLRDEITRNIQSHILSITGEDPNELHSYPHQLTEKILKLVEKSIDSTREQKDNHNYSGDDEFIDGFSLGFDFAIDKVKEEMLK